MPAPISLRRIIEGRVALLASPRTDALAAIAEAERERDARALLRSVPRPEHGFGLDLRCGDCDVVRAPHGACPNCRSERDPVAGPNSRRGAGSGMPYQ